MLRLELTEYSDDRMVLASLKRPKFMGYFFLSLAFVADLSALLLYFLFSFSLIFSVIIFVASLLPIQSGLSTLTSRRRMVFERGSQTLTIETKNIFRQRVRQTPFSEIEVVRVETSEEERTIPRGRIPQARFPQGSIPQGISPSRSIVWTIGLKLSGGDNVQVNTAASKTRMYDLADTISRFLGKGEVERTSHFIVIAQADEVLPGERKLVQVGEDSIVLFNVDGKYYAIQNSCPHQGWPLIHSHLEGMVVTCSLHNWKFNLQDGCSPLSDQIKAKVYPAKVEGDRVMIAV